MSNTNRVYECPHCHERQAFGQIHTPADVFDSREWFQVKCHACGGIGPRRQTLQEASDAFLTLRVAGPGECVVKVEDVKTAIDWFHDLNRRDDGHLMDDDHETINNFTAAIDAASKE